MIMIAEVPAAYIIQEQDKVLLPRARREAMLGSWSPCAVIEAAKYAPRVMPWPARFAEHNNGFYALNTSLELQRTKHGDGSFGPM